MTAAMELAHRGPGRAVAPPGIRAPGLKSGVGSDGHSWVGLRVQWEGSGGTGGNVTLTHSHPTLPSLSRSFEWPRQSLTGKQR